MGPLKLSLTEFAPGAAGDDLQGGQAGERQRDLLVLGPSLGTAVVPLWRRCARLLAGRFQVVGWDLPGHGSSPAHDEAFTVADLARAVVAAVEPLECGPWLYAGVSLGGAVGLELGMTGADVGAGLDAVAVICAAAKIGDVRAWQERAELVRGAGTAALVEGAPQRWFAPGFATRDPETSHALLASLEEADRGSYARACEALARFDVRDRLAQVSLPLLAVAGELDDVAPPAAVLTMADNVPDATAAVLEGVAHLAPAEAPERVAALLTDFFRPKGPP